MAITKIALDTSSVAANLSAVQSFLQGTGYFNYITNSSASDGSRIVCNPYVDYGMTIFYPNSATITQITIGSASGARKTYNIDGATGLDVAYSTNNGWAIVKDGTHQGIFASKDNNNKVVISVIGESTTDSQTYLASTTLTQSRIIELPLTYARPSFSMYNSSSTITDTLMLKTMFVPFMSYEGYFTQSLFYTPFSQYRADTYGKISDGNTEYWYNGIIALKG